MNFFAVPQAKLRKDNTNCQASNLYSIISGSSQLEANTKRVKDPEVGLCAQSPGSNTSISIDVFAARVGKVRVVSGVSHG